MSCVSTQPQRPGPAALWAGAPVRVQEKDGKSLIPSPCTWSGHNRLSWDTEQLRFRSGWCVVSGSQARWGWWLNFYALCGPRNWPCGARVTASSVLSRSFTAGRGPAWWAGSSALSCVSEATWLLTGALGSQHWDRGSPAHWRQGLQQALLHPVPPHSDAPPWRERQQLHLLVTCSETQVFSLLNGGSGFHPKRRLGAPSTLPRPLLVFEEAGGLRIPARMWGLAWGLPEECGGWPCSPALWTRALVLPTS